MADIQTATKLADMQIPEGWAQYTAQRSVEQDQFFTSGVIKAVPQIASAFTAGGYLGNMPFFKPLADTDAQVATDENDLTLNTIATGVSQARKLGFDQAWSATDLAAELAGADPLTATSNSVADYWRHFNEKIMLKTLDGVFASDTMKKNNQFDATAKGSTDSTFSLKNFNKARFQLGDRYRDLTMVVVHSDILEQLQNANVVDPKTNVILNTGNLPTQVVAPNPGDTIKGVKIVVDDSLPVKSGVYTSYLFASGAFGWSELPVDNAAATGRDELRFHGVDYLVNRRRFVLAPAGMSWNESAFQNDAMPSNNNKQVPYPGMDALANGKYWTRVADPKLIPFVKFTTSAEAITPAQTTTASTGSD
ncbi:phage capsid protein [Lactobacillus sp. 3B(2020)]|uniref:phage capsid protein n=1 Tax=Lactobacillus sp. 3B(2020) TaxID=2695882 RepID=UPI0015DF59C4|nr:phage capsid protein [Lactobacillus sp. 3B(2020)]QLL69593.1 phage capsid protein [Lactobacillus sp. 3B(2020)]